MKKNVENNESPACWIQDSLTNAPAVDKFPGNFVRLKGDTFYDYKSGLRMIRQNGWFISILSFTTIS